MEWGGYKNGWCAYVFILPSRLVFRRSGLEFGCGGAWGERQQRGVWKPRERQQHGREMQLQAGSSDDGSHLCERLPTCLSPFSLSMVNCSSRSLLDRGCSKKVWTTRHAKRNWSLHMGHGQRSCKILHDGLLISSRILPNITCFYYYQRSDHERTHL